MVDTITSYATAQSGGSSSSSSGSEVVNQVVFEHTDTGLLSKEYQEHSGVKDPSTPYVGYNYDETASGGRFTKGLRPTSLRYPNGRLVHNTYGTSGSTSDALNRIAAIKDDNAGSPGNSLAEYGYLGRNAIVQANYPEPDLRYDLTHGTGNDPHDGPMDRFGRVTDLLWSDYGSSTDAVRIKHGYDRAGNRLWREDPVAASNGKDFDELYKYDGMNQLVSLGRGDLNAGKTGISGTPEWEEDWTLDPTGNWTDYVQKTSGSTDLNQSRTHNAVNEITDITETIGDSWITPTHDRNGNSLQIMQADDPESYYTLTWDAWSRLVSIEDGDTPIAGYEYDGRSFRVVKKAYDAGTLDETRHFYYNNRWQILEERPNGSANADRQFIWGQQYVDNLVVRERDTSEPRDGVLNERLYGLQDNNWNVAALVEPDGAVQERFVYGAYGTPEYCAPAFGTRASSEYSWEILFAGYRRDDDAACYHVRNRDVAAMFGRWISRDPVEEDENLYRYVLNAPTLLVDPTGQSSMPQTPPPMKLPPVSSFSELELKRLDRCMRLKKWHIGFCPCCRCEETQWGLNLDKNYMKLVEGWSKLPANVTVVYGGGNSGLSLACPATRGVTQNNKSGKTTTERHLFLFINASNTCDAMVMLKHESTHAHQLGQWLKGRKFPMNRKRMERLAYEAQCRLATRMKCLSPGEPGWNANYNMCMLNYNHSVGKAQEWRIGSECIGLVSEQEGGWTALEAKGRGS